MSDDKIFTYNEIYDPELQQQNNYLAGPSHFAILNNPKNGHIVYIIGDIHFKTVNFNCDVDNGKNNDVIHVADYLELLMKKNNDYHFDILMETLKLSKDQMKIYNHKYTQIGSLISSIERKFKYCHNIMKNIEKCKSIYPNINFYPCDVRMLKSKLSDIDKIFLLTEHNSIDVYDLLYYLDAILAQKIDEKSLNILISIRYKIRTIIKIGIIKNIYFNVLSGVKGNSDMKKIRLLVKKIMVDYDDYIKNYKEINGELESMLREGIKGNNKNNYHICVNVFDMIYSDDIYNLFIAEDLDYCVKYNLLDQLTESYPKLSLYIDLMLVGYKNVIPKKYDFLDKITKKKYVKNNFFEDLKINKQISKYNNKYNITDFVFDEIKKSKIPKIKYDTPLEDKEIDEILYYKTVIFAKYMDIYLLHKMFKKPIKNKHVSVIVAGTAHTDLYIKFLEKNGYEYYYNYDVVDEVSKYGGDYKCVKISENDYVSNALIPPLNVA